MSCYSESIHVIEKQAHLLKAYVEFKSPVKKKLFKSLTFSNLSSDLPEGDLTGLRIVVCGSSGV